MPTEIMTTGLGSAVAVALCLYGWRLIDEIEELGNSRALRTTAIRKATPSRFGSSSSVG